MKEEIIKVSFKDEPDKCIGGKPTTFMLTFKEEWYPYKHII